MEFVFVWHELIALTEAGQAADESKCQLAFVLSGLDLFELQLEDRGLQMQEKHDGEGREPANFFCVVFKSITLVSENLDIRFIVKNASHLHQEQNDKTRKDVKEKYLYLYECPDDSMPNSCINFTYECNLADVIECPENGADVDKQVDCFEYLDEHSIFYFVENSEER